MGIRSQNRKLKPLPEGKPPDIGLVNFFPSEPPSSMELQDTTQSNQSTDAGHPVMGICIGDSCDFIYTSEALHGTQKPKTLRLESGDVYLFGGESRSLWHGVGKVLRGTRRCLCVLYPGISTSRCGCADVVQLHQPVPARPAFPTSNRIRQLVLLRRLTAHVRMRVLTALPEGMTYYDMLFGRVQIRGAAPPVSFICW